MSSSYFFMGSNLEKCGQFWKNGRFSGRIRPDWGNTAWADMAGLGSIGLIKPYCICLHFLYLLIEPIDWVSRERGQMMFTFKIFFKCALL